VIDISVNPRIRSEPNHVTDSEVQASIPVDDDQDVDDHFGDAKCVWEIRFCFGSFEKFE
jgi:hypothetical protein